MASTTPVRRSWSAYLNKKVGKPSPKLSPSQSSDALLEQPKAHRPRPIRLKPERVPEGPLLTKDLPGWSHQGHPTLYAEVSHKQMIALAAMPKLTEKELNAPTRPPPQLTPAWDHGIDAAPTISKGGGPRRKLSLQLVQGDDTTTAASAPSSSSALRRHSIMVPAADVHLFIRVRRLWRGSFIRRERWRQAFVTNKLAIALLSYAAENNNNRESRQKEDGGMRSVEEGLDQLKREGHAVTGQKCRLRADGLRLVAPQPWGAPLPVQQRLKECAEEFQKVHKIEVCASREGLKHTPRIALQCPTL